MKNKNQNYRFTKKSPKAKLSESKKENYHNDYSKIICELLNKEELNKKKNLNISFNKSNLTNIKNNINNAYNSTKNSKKIIKIELYYNNKNNSKFNTKVYSNTSIKDKKLYFNNHSNNNVNINKNKNMFQSNSEKNIIKEMTSEGHTKKKVYISNKNIISTNVNCTSLNKKRKCININPFTVSYNNKNEGNKSSEKKIRETMKNFEDMKEKTINLENKKHEIFWNKKGYELNKQFYQSNDNLNEIKNNKNNSTHKSEIINQNQKKMKSKNSHVNSPDKIIITINNVGSYNTGNKNKNKQKKFFKNSFIMNGLNSNDIDEKKINNLKNKKKYTKHNNTDSSTNSQIKKSSKTTLKKNYITNKKNNTNSSSKNSSNSKINYSNNQISNKKGVKIESINIDLNLTPSNNKKNNNLYKKVNKYNSLNTTSNLMFRETELPKYSSKFNHLELSLNCPNKSIELNQSFKSSFSLTKKTKSLSKKRDEKKKMNLFKFGDIIDEKENEKILNDILFNLSNQKTNTNENKYRNICQKSEPKKLIDKIRKAKKIKKQ